MTGHREHVRWPIQPAWLGQWGMTAARADRKRDWKMVKQWDFFSRSGMSVVGLLLLTMIVAAIYLLWDVAGKRWFG